MTPPQRLRLAADAATSKTGVEMPAELLDVIEALEEGRPAEGLLRRLAPELRGAVIEAIEDE